MKELDRLNFRDYSKIKGSDRIQINNLLVAICIPTLTIIISLSDHILNEASIIQLSIAIPFLVSSSLSYAKIAYRPESEFKIWDRLGWLLHSLGYIMIINSTALIIYFNKHIYISWILISISTLLFIIYSLIDILMKVQRRKEKIIKLALYLLIIIIGFVLPISI